MKPNGEQAPSSEFQGSCGDSGKEGEARLHSWESVDTEHAVFYVFADGGFCFSLLIDSGLRALFGGVAGEAGGET